MEELSDVLDRAQTLGESMDSATASLVVLSLVARDRELFAAWQAASRLCTPQVAGPPGPHTGVRMLPVVARERLLFEQVVKAKLWWLRLFAESVRP